MSGGTRRHDQHHIAGGRNLPLEKYEYSNELSLPTMQHEVLQEKVTYCVI